MDPNSQNKESVSYKGNHSWRELAEVKSDKITTFATVLRWLRDYAKTLIILCLCLGIGLYFKSKLSDADTNIAIANESRTSYIDKVLFKTSGVLDQQWLTQAISINQKQQLMEVDIFKMKADLENFKQVSRAEVTRVFPNSLKIDLIEEEPLFKIKIVQPEGEPFINIVSEKGVYYGGVGYSPNKIDKLPYLIPYIRADKSYDPIVGMDRVALLIKSLAEARISQKFEIKLVSLKNFPGIKGLPGQIIEIKTDSMPRILFGAFMDFPLQIKQLKYILSHLNGIGNPEVERVDLSLIGSAAVQLKQGRIDSF